MSDRMPIIEAERIAHKFGYDQVIIYARRIGIPGREWVTTYGATKEHCAATARIGAAIGGKVVKPIEEAVERLYYAAYWSPDRRCDAAELWTAVRDAAGLPAGQSRARLGEPNVPSQGMSDAEMVGALVFARDKLMINWHVSDSIQSRMKADALSRIARALATDPDQAIEHARSDSEVAAPETIEEAAARAAIAEARSSGDGGDLDG